MLTHHEEKKSIFSLLTELNTLIMYHRIAYQGEEGCYSESAVFQLFGGSDVNGLPCESFEVAFKSVVDGEATFALMVRKNKKKHLPRSHFVNTLQQ